MWSSRAYLAKCAQLKEAGLPPVFRPGVRIARGFADIGTEEFLLLPNEKLISLCNGVGSTLPTGHADFFFSVPTVDELVDHIQRRMFDVVSLTYRDQRTWELSVRSADGRVEKCFEASEIALALAEGLIFILEQSR